MKNPLICFIASQGGSVVKKNVLVALCMTAGLMVPTSVSLTQSYSAGAATLPLLKYGDQGSSVLTLQKELLAAGFFHTTPNGVFGPQTRAAVEALQKAHQLSVDGIVGASTWGVLSSSTTSSNHPSPSSGSSNGGDNSTSGSSQTGFRQLQTKSIYFNGKLIANPMAFAANNTTYMPIWYVGQMLKAMGIQSQWDGTRWNLILPQTMTPNLKNIQVGTGSKEIEINGQIVKKVDGIAYADPASHVMTTYMPIWYLMTTLDRLGIQRTWNGNTWDMTSTASGFSAYSKDGSQVLGEFSTEAAAQTSLANVPGGTVRDGSGKVLFTEPDFIAYARDGKTILGNYTTEAAAQASLSQTPGGTVRDLTGKVLFIEAQYVAVGKDGTTIIGSYATEAAAQNALANSPGGTVRDVTGKILYTAPDFIAMSADGHTIIGEFFTESAAQSALVGAPGGFVEDGNGQVVYRQSAYTAYQKNGQTVIGNYPSETAAQAAVSQIPGAMVKDANGRVVFTVPDYEAYSGAGQTPTDFLNLVQATQAIAGNPNGYVVDGVQNTVIELPQNYYFVSGAEWINTQHGNQGQAPSFAQPIDKYVSDANGQFYILTDDTGHYSGAPVGSGATTSSGNPFQTTDLRYPAPPTVNGPQMDQWLQATKNSPLQGLGNAFMQAQSTYGVDATYLMSHAIEETAWGTSSIYQNKDNLYGYGAYDSNPANDAGVFPSSEYAINFEAWVVRKNYLDPSGQFYVTPTLDGMNQHYASDPHWSQNIAQIMSQFVTATGSSSSTYKQYQTGNVAPMPPVTSEPIYRMNHALATVAPNPYGNLPVFVDPTVGSSQMFSGTLQLGSSGNAVSQIQSLVGVNPDGQYGPDTKSAVEAFQAIHHLPITGICDVKTWEAMFPVGMFIPAGTPVVVDQMKQGIVGNNVTEWYHVTAPTGVSGWVDSYYISPQTKVGTQLVTNWFRVHPNAGYEFSVYSSENRNTPPIATLHAGDYVITTQSYPVQQPVTADSQGYIQINYVDQTTGQFRVGFIDATASTLAPVTPPTPYTGP
jgi:peptidoglycan hydrolase-like protein with peptidoglycan-binding domain